MKRRDLIGEICQWGSAGVVLAGVVCEFIHKADVYLVAITAGSLIYAVSQKIKHPKIYKEGL